MKRTLIVFSSTLLLNKHRDYVCYLTYSKQNSLLIVSKHHVYFSNSFILFFILCLHCTTNGMFLYLFYFEIIFWNIFKYNSHTRFYVYSVSIYQITSINVLIARHTNVRYPMCCHYQQTTLLSGIHSNVNFFVLLKIVYMLCYVHWVLYTVYFGLFSYKHCNYTGSKYGLQFILYLFRYRLDIGFYSVTVVHRVSLFIVIYFLVRMLVSKFQYTYSSLLYSISIKKFKAQPIDLLEGTCTRRWDVIELLSYGEMQCPQVHCVTPMIRICKYSYVNFFLIANSDHYALLIIINTYLPGFGLFSYLNYPANILTLLILYLHVFYSILFYYYSSYFVFSIDY